MNIEVMHDVFLSYHVYWEREKIQTMKKRLERPDHAYYSKALIGQPLSSKICLSKYLGKNLLIDTPDP